MKRVLLSGVVLVLMFVGRVSADEVTAWLDYGLGGDEKPEARVAFDSASDYRLRFQIVEPEVGEAMLWALARRGEIEAQTLLDLSMLSRIPDRSRLGAVAALGQLPEEERYLPLLALIATGSAEDDAFERMVTWRAILAMHKPDMRSPMISPDKMVLSEWVQEPTEEQEALIPIYLAAVSKVGEAIAGRHAPGDPVGDRTRLACVEAADVWAYRFMDSERPVLERVLTTRIDVNFRVRDMVDAFGSDQPGVQELALLTVQERMEKGPLLELAKELVSAPETRRSGLVLAAMNGWSSAEVSAPLTADDSLRGYEQLLGASGDPRALVNVAAQFARTGPEAARACVLILFERGFMAEGLSLLFPLEGESVFDVRSWLVDQRGWHVLEAYLPEGAPGFWLYGDEEVQLFQLRAIARWWVLTVEHGGLADRAVIR